MIFESESENKHHWPVSIGSTYTILKMSKISAWCVLHEVKSEQKQQWAVVCEDMMRSPKQNGESLMKWIMTDEMWPTIMVLRVNNSPLSRNNLRCHSQKFSIQQGDFFYYKGILLALCTSQDIAMTEEAYNEDLHTIPINKDPHHAIRLTSPLWQFQAIHFSTWATGCSKTWSYSITYSPYLSPCNFHLFTTLKVVACIVTVPVWRWEWSWNNLCEDNW